MDALPSVLSPADLRHFDEHGFVLARGVVPPEQAARTARDVVEFAGRDEHRGRDFYLDPRAPDSWYDERGRCGFKRAVEVYHSQSMWDNRLCPPMHGLFAQLHGTARLHADKGRCSITPPSRDPTERQGLHWDIAALFAYMEYEGYLEKKNLAANGSSFAPVEAREALHGARSAAEGVGPLPQFALAAVLYLTDVPADGGAFTCVPGFHRRIDSWLGSLPPHVDGGKPWSEEDLLAMGPVAVPGRAGDVVIWNSLLPHGAGVNRSAQPRVVQYVGLDPAPAAVDAELLESNRRWHAERTGSPRLGMPPEPGAPTVFRSATARCLAGLEAWPDTDAAADGDGEMVRLPATTLASL